MNEVFEINGIRADPGSKQFGWLQAGDVGTQPVKIPLTIVNGAAPGPVLCVTAGIHGCEYVGIEAAIRLGVEIDPKTLKGTLLIVPVVNIPGFVSRSAYINPLDGLNMNRVCPGDPSGSMSYQITHTLFEKIISKTTHGIDLHGGDLGEGLTPLSMFFKTGNSSIDNVSETMVHYFGIKYVWETAEEYGGWVPNGTITVETVKKGIPSITAEAGEKGLLEEQWVTVLYKGITNVMKYLGMIEGAPQEPTGQKRLRNGTFYKAQHGGLFYAFANAGDEISRGQVLGEVRNLQGEVLETITSKVDGVLLMIKSNPLLHTNDLVYLCAEIQST